MTRQFKKQIQNQSQTEYMQNNQPQTMSGEAGKKNRINPRSQSGRSMIEMLGVLAIIAILSIGGIVGYKLAMNYYQADQIANEINLMRNDLKVKYALGNEELLLGDPYDDTPENENYSGHLSTQYDRYPVDYDCIIRGKKESKNELYNCREADAYYIAVGNISKGVCKPLTTLVAAMDGRLEMDINGISYTEDDLCDENNEIYVEFDAKDVNGNYDSNRPEGWCAKDEDCSDEKPFCENKKCVECTTSADCENPKPYCNPASNQCAPCENDSQCDATQNEHCTSDGKCVVCDVNTEVWDEELKDCRLPKSCEELDCSEGTFCLSSDCNVCSNDTITENCASYTCKQIDEYKHKNKDSSTTYVISNTGMNWWSAQRFCAKQNRHLLKISQLSCGAQEGSNQVGYGKNCGTYQNTGFCHKSNSAISCGQSSLTDVNEVVKALMKARNGSEDTGTGTFWLKNAYSENSDNDTSCRAYDIDIPNGYLEGCFRTQSDYHLALCVN